MAAKKRKILQSKKDSVDKNWHALHRGIHSKIIQYEKEYQIQVNSFRRYYGNLNKLWEFDKNDSKYDLVVKPWFTNGLGNTV